MNYKNMLRSIVFTLILFVFSIQTPGLAEQQAAEVMVSTRAGTLELPALRLPYSNVASVQWSSGPHPYGSANITGTHPVGTGSGLDFAGTEFDPVTQTNYGLNFRVLAMAAGTVAGVNKNCSEEPGIAMNYGCWVAVRHAGNGGVIIYAHLQPNTITVNLNDVVVQGRALGRAGKSNGQAAVHLHVEFRQGNPDAECRDPANCWFGDPYSWDDLQELVDGYIIGGYFADTEGLTVYNYDGSAIRTSTGGDIQVIYDFPFLDNGTPKTGVARVHTDFDRPEDCLNATNCENNAHATTQFAWNGNLGAGQTVASSTLPGASSAEATQASGTGGMLISSNVPYSPAITPTSGILLCDGENYAPACFAYTWDSNEACIDLGASGMDNRAESVSFQGDYATNFEVVMYSDNQCGVYSARFGSSSGTLPGWGNQISSIRIEKKIPPPPPQGGRLELCQGTDFGGGCTPYTWSNNSQCIDLNGSGMNDQAESLRFFDWYIGNFDAIFYGDNACATYLARFGDDAKTFNGLNNQFSSLRIEQHGTLNPNGSLQLCDGENYGGQCNAYRYVSNGKCYDLNETGMSDKADSLRFLESYVGNFDAILYQDNACGTYIARFGEDAVSLGGLNNQPSSFRLEKHLYLVPEGFIDYCDGMNYAGECKTYRYVSDGQCIDLNQTGMNDRGESFRFRNGYIGEFDLVFYGDNGCQVYNARYGEDATTFGNLNNQFGSMKFQHHGPIMPDLTPYAGNGWQGMVNLSAVPGTLNSGELTAGKSFFLDWGYKNIGDYASGAHAVEIYLDNMLIARHESGGLAGDSWYGVTDQEISQKINPGWHHVSLIIDADENQSEANETNNIWTGTFFWKTGTARFYVPLVLRDYAKPGDILYDSGTAWDQPHDVYLMNSEGGNIRRITNGPGSNVSAVFSPDQSKIAFLSDRDGNWGLYVMNLNGTGLVRVAYVSGLEIDWSVQNKIVFIEEQSHGVSTINPDGSQFQQLTASFDGSPSWSPDGNTIAYQTYYEGNWEIFTMRADGSGKFRVTNNPGASDGHPRISPDGQWIAYAINSQAYMDQIALIRTDGTGMHTITGMEHNEHPVWSPDGKRILFNSNRSGFLRNLYIMNSDGSNPVRMSYSDEVALDWAP